MSGPAPRSLALFRESHAADPAFDTAVSRVLLGRVASGVRSESLRLHVPGSVVAFSPLDATRPGFERARQAAFDAGFGAIRRLAGGHAAVFHEETLAFAWCIPDPEPRARIHQRFEAMANIACRALQSLGVDARVGEVAGEYCPGEHSVNARGRRKLVGVGQRLVRGGAHVGGVIVVGGSDRIRKVLTPVYDALELPWDPETTGSIADEIDAPSLEDVASALCAEFAREAELESRHFEVSELQEAYGLAEAHRA
ncbi:MAG: lipoate--protein ligase family protein [Myxococcota bacterium]|nr:lipoate--protein ligase family protein [Myxococcota bacterium]